MKRLGFLLSLALVANVALANAAPFSCKYNDDDGVPTRLYRRVESDAADWYSRYKEVRFCDRLHGQGSYVLILEELIRGFRVLNVPRAILGTTPDSLGGMSYAIADDLDHVVLNISADGQTMDARGTWGQEQYAARLKLVWKND